MTDHDLRSLEDLIEAYEQHQRRTRGLREATLRDYRRLIWPFLRAALGEDPIDPARLQPAHTIDFIASLRGRYSPRSMKLVRSALRSLFRFLRFEGICDERLETTVPAVAHWRLSTLPRHLSEEQLDQVLSSLGASTTAYGRRDRAIVQCLATLGLRPGEVASMRLEDIDWSVGTVHVRTRKNHRGAIVPLPREAGGAIVEYLRDGRPAAAGRHLFVKHVGPHCGEPITAGAISEVAVRAMCRAEIKTPLAGAYVFRHTLATRMVRHGASLQEIADFLGHRSLDTTAIYAKVDVPTLREVALPWPGAIR